VKPSLHAGRRRRGVGPRLATVECVLALPAPRSFSVCRLIALARVAAPCKAAFHDADILAKILARMSVSVSWNAALRSPPSLLLSSSVGVLYLSIAENRRRCRFHPSSDSFYR